MSTQKVDLSVPGKLTIHGVTKDVTASAQAQVVGDKIEVASNPSSPLVIDMTDYGITPPQVPFTKVDSKVTLAFDIFLTKSA
ncbi:MAG: YceI family protein [Chloroflexi bacterium]|nr:MAG: YceI family protein [Chloroflexota bacterium]